MTYRHATTLLLAILAPTALAGCQPKGDLGEYTASDSSESDAETGATSSATTGETGETGDPGCAAPEQDFKASFVATLDPQLAPEVNQFSANCTVDTLTVEANFVSVALACDERSVTLDFTVSTGFTPLFTQGDTLALTYHQTMPFWTNEWFTLRTTNPDSGVLLGGVQGESLQPLADATLFAPIQLQAKQGVCAGSIDCNDPFERLAVDVSYDQDSQELVPGHSTLVGTLTSMRVDLDAASRYVDMMNCQISDTPPEWFGALLILLPEG